MEPTRSEIAALCEKYRNSEFSAAVAAKICLNHAGVSPTAARIVRAVTAGLQGMSTSPLDFFMQTLAPTITTARERMARLMGVPAEHLAFTKNTGHGLSIIADGLALDPGDNIVTAGCEYPAVVYPWYGQQWRGVETRIVPVRPDGTLHIEDFLARMDSKTRVVAISWIQFGTGFRANMAEFAAMAHAHGAILVADVIQGTGALPCHVAEWGVDAAAVGAHKWLMAPAGTGGLYIAPHVLDRMHLVNMGASSVVNAMAFDSTVFNPKPTAQRYEEGSINSLGLIGLESALSMLEDVGIENIGAQILSLAAFAAGELETKGYQVMTPKADDARAGLVMFRHPTHSNDDIVKALTDAGVVVAARGGSVRFSPHFYNNEADIRFAVEALPG